MQTDGDPWIFDFDNHYYESPDAFTRHQDRSLGNRGVRWAEVDGKRRLLVGGTVNSYVANPTFDPVARPGSLFDWYRGNRNPGYFAEHPRDVFGEHVWVTPFWEDDVGGLLADMRVDRLLLGSDWPHAEGVRQPADFVTDSLAGLPDADVRRIARENALELLGLAGG